MRLATVVLLAMFAVLQYTLWLGKGGWLRIGSLERDIEAQVARQMQLRESNAVGRADVEDLRSGLDAVEERARREIGMVRKDETFFQYPQAESGTGAAGAPDAAAARK
ncbi:MAG: cell division protein FtsB [Rhodocyclaceae bacterium]|nr:cell division protein FtsB [Rhodocyclaceae bacterium]